MIRATNSACMLSIILILVFSLKRKEIKRKIFFNKEILIKNLNVKRLEFTMVFVNKIKRLYKKSFRNFKKEQLYDLILQIS